MLDSFFSSLRASSIEHREAPALSIKGTNLTVGNSNYTAKARAFQSRFSILDSRIGYLASSAEYPGGRWAA